MWEVAIGEVLLCIREPTNVGELSGVKLYSRKKFSYVFCVQKYFYNEKSELRYFNFPVKQQLQNYDVCQQPHHLVSICLA